MDQCQELQHVGRIVLVGRGGDVGEEHQTKQKEEISLKMKVNYNE